MKELDDDVEQQEQSQKCEMEICERNFNRLNRDVSINQFNF